MSGRFKKFFAKSTHDRRTSLQELDQLLTRIHAHQGHYIEIDVYHKFRIMTMPLEQRSSGKAPGRHFFNPMTDRILRLYPINLDDEDTAYRIAWRDNYLTHGAKEAYGIPPSPYSRIEVLGCELIEEYFTYARHGINDGKGTLKKLGKWRIQSTHPFDELLDSRRTNIQPRWMIHPTMTMNSRTPHMKMVIIHDLEDPNEALLRNELLAIVTAMKHQLSQPNLAGHKIIPVMIISAFRPLHARVLIAYFDGSHLVIQKSANKSFEELGGRRSIFDFCTAFVAASVNEEEDTTKL
ncbi:hypothetical protein BJX70DRAFT_123361 [Aspergillus crustosus]